MARKAVTRELGSGPLPGPVLAFIDAELEEGRRHLRPPQDIRPECRHLAEAFFRSMIRQFSS